MAILKNNHVPRSKGAVKAAGKSAKYYTFREGDDRAGRIWRAKDGRNLDYAEARDIIREHAKTHGYTYRLMISTKDTPLTMDDYRDVMNTLGETWIDYCFIEHRNTEHPHAHVLAWRKTAMSGKEATAMRGQLAEREQQRDHEREQRVAREQAQQVARQHDRNNDLGL